MTESEAQKWLEKFEWDDSEETSEALGTICEALQEYPKFRAIGTVEGYERAIESSIENYNLYREYKTKVQEYSEIGTVEEFKALKEKTIDEFAEKLCTDVESFAAEVNGMKADVLTLDYFTEFVFEIAEQMKGGETDERNTV